MQRPSITRCPTNSRRGVATIAVLALFAVASILFVTWTRDALQRSQSQKRQHEQVQATWLAESALQRAVAKLQQDESYEGETWKLSASELGQLGDAEILIQVTSASDKANNAEVTTDTAKTDASDSKQPNQFTISVQADLPPGDERHVRHTRTIQYTRNPR